MHFLSRIALLAVFLLTAHIAMAQQAPTYTVKRGDTLFRIAQAHNLTVEELRELNNLRSNQIEVGQVLRVGSAADPQSTQAPQVYVVKSGDTLFSIARRHEVSVADLRAWNDLSDNLIAVGQRLQIQAPAATPPRPQSVTPTPPPPAVTPRPRPTAPPQPARDTPPPADAGTPPDTLRAGYGRHEVAAGETLYGIGMQYGLPVDTLLALNPDLGTMLEAGAVLRLPAAFATVSYRVRQGDTLGRIAQRYGVGVAALKNANGLRNDLISVGQELRVPSAAARPVYDEPRLPEVESSGAVLAYPATFEGRLTASGAPYRPERFTASHQTLPLGSIVLLTNPATGRSTFAEVNDRGPISNRYVMDVSDAVVRQLELEDENNMVEVRRIQ